MYDLSLGLFIHYRRLPVVVLRETSRVYRLRTGCPGLPRTISDAASRRGADGVRLPGRFRSLAQAEHRPRRRGAGARGGSGRGRKGGAGKVLAHGAQLATRRAAWRDRWYTSRWCPRSGTSTRRQPLWISAISRSFQTRKRRSLAQRPCSALASRCGSPQRLRACAGRRGCAAARRTTARGRGGPGQTRRSLHGRGGGANARGGKPVRTCGLGQPVTGRQGLRRQPGDPQAAGGG